MEQRYYYSLETIYFNATIIICQAHATIGIFTHYIQALCVTLMRKTCGRVLVYAICMVIFSFDVLFKILPYTLESFN